MSGTEVLDPDAARHTVLGYQACILSNCCPGRFPVNSAL
jgi:hypothetical protein